MIRSMFVFLLISWSINIIAQDAGLSPRPYKKEEMTRWTQVCDWFSKSIPQQFRDYSLKKEDCSTFEWAETNKQKQPLTVINKKNEPIGNSPYFNTWFSKNPDSADAQYMRIMAEILDAKTSANSFDEAKMKLISARGEKLQQCRTLQISCRVNVTVDLAKQYYVSTKPVRLDTTISPFAYLYRFPQGKVLLDENGEPGGGTDANAFYKDKALIIISFKSPRVVAEPSYGKSTWRQDRIFPLDNAPDVSTAAIKNIVIEIDGDETDIKEILKQIDWKFLQTRLGK